MTERDDIMSMTLPLHVQALEECFAPSNRYREMHRDLPCNYTEVALTGSSVKKLSTTWKGFHAFVGHRRIVWTGTGAFITTAYPGNRGSSSPFGLKHLFTGSTFYIWPQSNDQADLVSCCDFLIGLLAQT